MVWRGNQDFPGPVEKVQRADSAKQGDAAGGSDGSFPEVGIVSRVGPTELFVEAVGDEEA